MLYTPKIKLCLCGRSKETKYFLLMPATRPLGRRIYRLETVSIELFCSQKYLKFLTWLSLSRSCSITNALCVIQSIDKEHIKIRTRNLKNLLKLLRVRTETKSNWLKALSIFYTYLGIKRQFFKRFRTDHFMLWFAPRQEYLASFGNHCLM